MEFPSNNSNDNDKGRYENDIRNSVKFDYGAFGWNVCKVLGNLLWECLRDGIDRHLTKKMFELLVFFDSLPEEERKALIGWAKGKSFREIGKDICRDKLTAQNRYYSAMDKLKKSPVVNIDFEPERYLKD